MKNNKKTLEEHKNYVEQLARLSFFFAARLFADNKSASIGGLVRDCTPLFHHALNYPDYETKWNNPDCLRIKARADELGALPPGEFEEAMYAEIKDLAMERAGRFYSTSVGVGMPPGYNAGSLKYDPPKPNLPANHCNFHIANAVAPKSIFDDSDYLPDCFLELMDKSAKEYGYDILRTSTWLNDHPRWLVLFPQEWHDNLSPASNQVGWNFGYWGQLTNARGAFNEKAGRHVREHCELKYKTRASHCSFQAMRQHLLALKDGRKDNK